MAVKIIKLTGKEAEKAVAKLDEYFKERASSITARGGNSTEGVVYSKTGKVRGLDEQD